MSFHSPLKGESLKIIFIILLGWTAFSLADSNTKFLTQSYNPSFIAAFCAMFNFIITALWLLWERGWRGFLSPEWKWFLLRGVLIGMVAFGVSNALSYIPIADVYGIVFSVPFLSVALSVLLLKENVGLHRWLSIIIGFIGVLILVGPQYEVLNIGLLYAAIAAISGAFSILVLRKIGNKHSIPLLVLYSYLGIAVVNIPVALPDLIIPSTPSLYFFLAGSALLLFGAWATTYGIAHARSTASVAPFIYIQAIWGVILGYIFFGDTPTLPTLIGLIIIIGAGVYMLYNEKQLSRITPRL